MGKEKTIKKYFTKDRISVSHIPSVDNPSELFRDLKQLQKEFCLEFVRNVGAEDEGQPCKNTSKGLPIDGEALRVLTKKLVEAMNSANDSWKDFGNVYAAMERYICTRRYKKYIKPVLLQQTSREMEDNMLKALRKFEQECSLLSEIEKAEEALTSTLKEKRKREEEEKKKTRRMEKIGKTENKI